MFASQHNAHTHCGLLVNSFTLCEYLKGISQCLRSHHLLRMTFILRIFFIFSLSFHFFIIYVFVFACASRTLNSIPFIISICQRWSTSSKMKNVKRKTNTNAEWSFRLSSRHLICGEREKSANTRQKEIQYVFIKVVRRWRCKVRGLSTVWAMSTHSPGQVDHGLLLPITFLLMTGNF